MSVNPSARTSSLWLFTAACAPRSAVLPASAKAAQVRRETAQEMLTHARAFAASGDFTRAEQYLNLAADVGIPREDVVPLLMDVCVRDHRYRAAIQYAEQHLRDHPRDYSLRFVLATLLLATGDPARARDELESVLRAQNEHAEAHYTLAIVLRDDLNDRSRADRHFREYLRLAPGGRHSEQAEESLLKVVP